MRKFVVVATTILHRTFHYLLRFSTLNKAPTGYPVAADFVSGMVLRNRSSFWISELTDWICVLTLSTAVSVALFSYGLNNSFHCCQLLFVCAIFLLLCDTKHCISRSFWRKIFVVVSYPRMLRAYLGVKPNVCRRTVHWASLDTPWVLAVRKLEQWEKKQDDDEVDFKMQFSMKLFS